MKVALETPEIIKAQDPQDIYEIIRKVFYEKKGEVDLMKEHFWVFSLNNDLKVLSLELTSMGGRHRTTVDPAEVFRIPLYKSATCIILVHNHPSGTLKPSDPDIDITNRLMKAGDILDIKVVDHIIVSPQSFYSFKESELIDKLQLDTKYALTFVYKKQMEQKMEELKKNVERVKREYGIQKKKEGLQQGEQKGIKKRNQEIARELLLLGIDEKAIIKSTGLPKQWIGRIKKEIKEEEPPQETNP